MCRGLGGWRHEGDCLIGRVPAWDIDKVLEVDGGDGYTTPVMYLMPLHDTLRTVNFALGLFYYNF